MGKPRLLVLIRHAQSEGNKNRDIHQLIPDHRVKLTEDGWREAEEAGRRLRHLLKPDDTLQIFTSPYRRTRETTEGLLKTLTARDDPDDPEAAPSPFSRSKIKVYEEPRLREQDFGNFQPCSAEMERMWRERADYGHFFYRIPNGESAADAYDRISGFNESLWRQFGDADFPSVCVLVTHGLMTRVFLMKWYHWSVEYFEDLRNVNHCEFIVMQKNLESGKYVLQNHLRTWSELKRQRAEEALKNPSRRNTLSNFLMEQSASPSIPARKWGGCVGGCNHQHHQPSRREQLKLAEELSLPPAVELTPDAGRNEAEGHALGNREAVAAKQLDTESSILGSDPHSNKATSMTLPVRQAYKQQLVAQFSDDGGAGTPHEMSDTENEYFSAQSSHNPRTGALAQATRKVPQKKATPEDIERWVNESGMGRGKHADALGDEPDPADRFSGNDREQGSTELSDERLESIEQEENRDKSLRGSVY